MSRKLEPINEAVEIKGSLFYDYHSRACSIIRLKKDLINKFPQLKDRMAKIKYELLLQPNFQELIQNIEKLKENGEPVPIMMFLVG